MSQSLKLGLSGSETELPEGSRIFSNESNELLKIEDRSVDGTLHTDFVAYKRTFAITWDVYTEETKLILEGHIKSQITNGSYLSFIKTDQSGTPETIVVSAELGDQGALVPKDVFYNYSTTITLREV